MAKVSMMTPISGAKVIAKIQEKIDLRTLFSFLPFLSSVGLLKSLPKKNVHCYVESVASHPSFHSHPYTVLLLFLVHMKLNGLLLSQD